MQFADYLEKRGLSIADASRELGERHETVRRWAHRQRTPRPGAQRKVKLWSGGMVTADDWIDGAADLPTTTEKAA